MDELHSLAESLRKVQHFQHLGLSDLLAIVSSGQVRHFRPEQTVFAEGEPCAGMFVLMRGQIHLTKTGPQGQVNILAIINPVIMFNEVAVLDGGPNPVSAVAVQDAHLWQINAESFQALLKHYPQIGLGLLRVLARRNRQMIEQYEDLSFRSVLSRAAKLLLELSAHGKQAINRREHSINEMSSRIASVPEAISRSLNTFKAQGLIECSRTQILILHSDELARLAQVDAPALKP